MISGIYISPTVQAATNTAQLIQDIESIDGMTFTEKLLNAIDIINPGGCIDLTNLSSDVELTQTIVVDKDAVTIKWPSIDITYTGAGDMFEFQGDSIRFTGTGRSKNFANRGDVTNFIMQSGRYHFYGRGVQKPFLDNFDCDGIKSDSSLSYPNLDGSGGIYFEKMDPGTTGGGNNIETLFENIYMENTYAHGFYLDTPILSGMANCRVSNARGHCFYQNGGTSTKYTQCFASSGDQAGFCLQGISYAVLDSCASEFQTLGYWFRSCFGVTTFGTGAESNKNGGANITPCDLETTDEIGDPVEIDDISNDFLNDFRGTSCLISGGQQISLFTFNSSNPGQASASGLSNNTRHFHLKGNVRNCSIFNPRITVTSGSDAPQRFEWEFEDLGGDTPSDIIIYYDPTDGELTPVIADFYTDTNDALQSTHVLTDTDDILFQAGPKQFIPRTVDLTKRMTVNGENYALE